MILNLQLYKGPVVTTTLLVILAMRCITALRVMMVFKVEMVQILTYSVMATVKTGL